MPRRESDSDSSSHRSRSRRKKNKRSSRRSTSVSSASRSSSKERPRRYRVKSRSRSRSKDRKSRSRSREYSSRSSHKKSHRKHQKRRSTSRHRSRHDRRSRSRSRGRRSRRSRSDSRSDSQSRSSKMSSKYSRSNSVSPKRSKSHKGSDAKSKNMSEDEILKAKLQAAFKAAANADAMLREKGLLPECSKDTNLSTEAITELTIDQQVKRAQAIEDINSPSFVQQDFKSSRPGNKNKLELPSDTFPTVIDSNGKNLKIDDSWKNNAEKLVHPNLFKDQDIKMEKWKEKLAAMRSKSIDVDNFV